MVRGTGRSIGAFVRFVFELRYLRVKNAVWRRLSRTISHAKHRTNPKADKIKMLRVQAGRSGSLHTYRLIAVGDFRIFGCCIQRLKMSPGVPYGLRIRYLNIEYTPWYRLSSVSPPAKHGSDSPCRTMFSSETGGSGGLDADRSRSVTFAIVQRLSQILPGALCFLMVRHR